MCGEYTEISNCVHCNKKNYTVAINATMRLVPHEIGNNEINP